MTIRKFWFAFSVYTVFFAAMVLCAHVFGWTSVFTSTGMEEDERFRLEIEQIPARSEAPFFALMKQSEYDTIDDMMRAEWPNLIVRVTLTERGNSTVYDPFGEYSDKHLGGQEAAALYICTPYEARIEEVIIGDPEQFLEGDSFLFYAPYGSVYEYSVRYADTPIFSLGREYIMFFSVLDVETIGRWFDLTHPSAVAEIMVEDERTFNAMTDSGIKLFDGTGSDVETLAEHVRALYADCPYQWQRIPMVTPIGSKKE